MTFYVKCDVCGRMAEAPTSSIGEPYNPEGWWSRHHEEKMEHVCSWECKEKIGGITAPW